MKLTKKQENSLMQVYEAYWAEYLNGNVEAMVPLLDDSYTQVGSAESEVFSTKKEAVQFLRDTIDEVAGKLEMRNRITKLEQQDGIVLVHERCDLYALTGKEWVFYSRFRATSLLQEKKTGWKITHQHSSFPDTKTEKGQNVAIDKIAQENQELRDAIKRRTAELELKNRELQIEAALERIRARAMAMQSSEELHDVLCVLFQQFDVLGIKPISAFLSLFSSEERTLTYRATGTSGARTQGSQTVEIDSLEVWKEVYDKWKTDTSEAVEVIHYPTEILPKLFDLFEETFSAMPADERMSPEHFPEGGYTMHGHTRFGYIGYNHTRLPTEEEKEILTKFAIEFERVYQRFLDIENAEAQARQAQIEAALERVRTRTMAMHNTEDIAATVTTFFNEIRGLGLGNTTRSGIGILSQSEKMELWTASVKDKSDVVLHEGLLDMTIHPLTEGVKKAWRDGDSHFTYELSGNDKLVYFRAINKAPEYPMKIDLKKLPETVYHYSFPFRDGSLFVFSDEHLQDDIQDIFKRFAAVFGQTYTRYLDLHKAEAQAREAQIETSLERIRARAMGMQKSEELSDVLAVLFQQFDVLGIHPVNVWLSLYNKEDRTFTYRATGTSGKRIHKHQVIDLDAMDIWKESVEQWENGTADEVIVTHYPPEVFPQLLEVFHETFMAMPEKERIHPKDFPDGGYNVQGYCKFGFIGFNHKIPPTEEEKDILKKFATEFERLYQRFLDIEKAEAQAREAHIEASLERIRARSMAMHKSEELVEVATALYNELINLQVSEFSDASIVIFDESNNQQIVWGARTESEFLEKSTMPLLGDKILQELYDNWHSGEPFFTLRVGHLALKDHNDFVFPIADRTEKEDRVLKNMPDPTFFNCAVFSIGYIELVADQELKEESKSLLIRFAKVFDQTFTRFLDLQKAEEQAREAEIQLSIERIRAKTMAMQESTELTEVLSVTFQQLKLLGVETIWTHLTLVHLEENAFTYRMTGRNGERIIAEEKISLDASEHWKHISDAIKSPDKDPDLITRFEVPAEGLDAIWRLFDGIFSKLPEGQKVSPSDFPNGLYTTQAYCKFGFFGLNYTREATEEEADILLRFTTEFSSLYQRFLDLKQAETRAREAQIEAAIEKVRSQSLAMHNTSEMQQVANAVFDQLRELGLEMDAVGMSGVIEAKQDYDVWVGGAPFGRALRIPYNEDTKVQRDYNKAIKLRHELFAKTYSGKVKEEYINHLLTHGEFPKALKKKMVTSNAFSTSIAFAKNSGIQIARYTSKPYTTEENELLKRFVRVFEQAYIRFMDLEKAEAQARESKIEAALERVRSRSMAMHESREMLDVITVVSDQLRELNLKFDTVSFAKNVREGAFTFWISARKTPKPLFAVVPPIDSPVLNRVNEAKKRGSTFISDVFTKEESKEWSVHLINNSEIKYYPETVKNYILNAPGFARSSFFLKNIDLYVGNYKAIPYTEEENSIFRRFAQVFEQAYTRFLDLQKAEAQAREAQIEAALERVRAASMAMHQTQDIGDVVVVFFDQLKQLNIPFEQAWINIFHLEERYLDTWFSPLDGIYPEPTYFKLPSGPWEETAIKSWKSGAPFAYMSLETKVEVDQFLEACDEITDSKYFTHIQKKRRYDRLEFLETRHKYGFISKTSKEKPTKEDEDILQRFAKVFEQTYTRFLDIEKAEEQAREAQIEAALEKVRSRSLAMQKPEELQEVVAVVAEELKKLGVVLDVGGVVLCTYFANSKDVIHWTASDDSKHPSVPFFLPYFEDTLFDEAWASKLSGEPYFAKNFSYEVKNAWFEKAFEISDYRDLPEDYKKQLLGSESHGIAFAWAENSAIMVPSLEGNLPTEAEKEILIRFAKVFEQAYIRFMDLQKAEAQARESQIEVALERVRSRAMAMHHTDELTDVLGVLFEQFDFLGINPVLTHLTLFDEENETFTLRIARGGKKQVIAEQLIDVNAVENWKVSFANWKKSELHAVDCIDYPPEVLPAVWEVLDGVMSALPEGQKIHPSDFPDGLYTTQGHCKYGYIGFNHSRRATEEEKDIVIRFAKEFGRLYQRFLDIQKAELQAREALKQATLDRVRGQIASMRSAEDLERITPLVWNELNALGIPFIRCGVFIIEEADRTVQAFLSAPDGHSLGAMRIPFDADKDTAETVAHWKKGEVYRTHWDRKQFLDFMQNMTDLGQVSNQKQYQGAEQPPESLHLHFVPFTQGMMYVGNVEPLVGEQLALVQSLADAFAIAYARYEDFSRLEKAKERVETTLSELRATQNQLVQSEKMASLGELTAGIAHEIQNPLNFVNNFSEVSVELIVEMQEEIRKGDLEEAMAIMEDIRQNLDKINHHGKRADGIVKGMLQHSRASSGEKESTDLNVLADEYLRLAYHGLRAKDKSFNATLETHFDKSIGKVKVVPQDMGRVILNLITNAFHVVKEKSSLARTSEGERYEPTVSVSTKKTREGVEISVKDNGNGIPEAIKEKIFQPFFTTKPTGQGTGLGLSMSYDIVTKGHGGELKVDTKLGEGTTFTITIPDKQAL